MRNGVRPAVDHRGGEALLEIDLGIRVVASQLLVLVSQHRVNALASVLRLGVRLRHTL